MSRRPTWPVWVALGVPFVVVFAVLAVRAWTVDWYPVHDFALIELRVSDVGGGNWPLIGPYSRFGWTHPGPLLFELLAVPYRLLGSRPQALLVGSVVLNALAVAGALAIARRRGGMVLVAAVALVLALLMRALGGDVLMSPWNPWITVLPSMVFVLLLWSIAERDWVAVPWAVLVGSFLVQSEVAYTPLVLVTVAVVAVFAWLTRSSGRLGRRLDPAPSSTTGRRSARAMLLVGAGVMVVVWLPPLIDLVVGSHNLANIVRHFADRPPAAGLEAAAGVLSRQATLWGPWSTGNEPLEPFVGSTAAAPAALLLIPVALLVAGLVIAARRRDRAGTSLAVLALAALAVALESVARIEGVLFTYLVRFTWVVGAVAWLAILRAWAPAVATAARRWRGTSTSTSTSGSSAAPSSMSSSAATSTAASTSSEPRRRRPIAVALVAAATAVVLLAILLTVPNGWSGAMAPDADQNDVMARIEAAVLPTVRDEVAAAGGGQVLLRAIDSDVAFPAPNADGLAIGLLPRLERAGLAARVGGEWRFRGTTDDRWLFSVPRVDDGGPIAGTITVVGEDQLDTYQPDPGSRQLIRLSDDTAVAAARRDLADLQADLVAAGHPELAQQSVDQLTWIPFQYPELADEGPRIASIVTALDQPRAAVFWTPGRPPAS